MSIPACRPVDRGAAARLGSLIVGLVVAVCMSGCSGAGGSPCDQMRRAQDHVSELEGRASDGGRNPEDAPGRDELMAAYDDAASKTDACTASLQDR